MSENCNTSVDIGVILQKCCVGTEVMLRFYVGTDVVIQYLPVVRSHGSPCLSPQAPCTAGFLGTKVHSQQYIYITQTSHQLTHIQIHKRGCN